MTTSAENRISRIQTKLQQALAPETLEVIDEGHLHVGHAGAQTGLGHFRIRIISKEFANVAPLKRHQMVYHALGDMMQTDIHALSIDARASA